MAHWLIFQFTLNLPVCLRVETWWMARRSIARLLWRRGSGVQPLAVGRRLQSSFGESRWWWNSDKMESACYQFAIEWGRVASYSQYLSLASSSTEINIKLKASTWIESPSADVYGGRHLEVEGVGRSDLGQPGGHCKCKRNSMQITGKLQIVSNHKKVCCPVFTQSHWSGQVFVTLLQGWSSILAVGGAVWHANPKSNKDIQLSWDVDAIAYNIYHFHTHQTTQWPLLALQMVPLSSSKGPLHRNASS